jgi:hypothetical protein
LSVSTKQAALNVLANFILKPFKIVYPMAITQNFLIGRTRKSAGGATFSTYKGLNIVKAKAVSVANPRTQGQVQNRNTIKELVAEFRRFPNVIRKAFAEAPNPISEFNQFVRENYQSAKAAVLAGNIKFDLSLFVGSKGTLSKLDVIDYTWTNATKNLSFSHADASKPDQSPTDQNQLIVVSEKDGIVVALENLAPASVPAFDADLSGSGLKPGKHRAYVFLYSPTKGKVSDPNYIEFTVI